MINICVTFIASHCFFLLFISRAGKLKKPLSLEVLPRRPEDYNAALNPAIIIRNSIAMGMVFIMIIFLLFFPAFSSRKGAAS